MQKKGHKKRKVNCLLPNEQKSSISPYDKQYYCELFSLLDTMDPKVLSSLGSLSHRQLDAEKLCKEVPLCPCIVFILCTALVCC